LILKRCPSCRGVCDVERSPRCFSCGAEIAGAVPALTRKRPPKVLRLFKKNKSQSTALLITFAVFGGLGVLGVIASDADPVLRIGLGVLFLTGVVLGIRAMMGREAGTLSHAVLRLFAMAGVLVLGGTALLVGLLLLVSIACAIGIFK
jgi:hypothetical protein